MGGGMMGGGGGKGGDTSGGGVSPEQAALAQYTFGQNELRAQGQFAGLGMGPSTGETQAVGGARFQQAEDLAKMSDANAKAMQAFNQQQNSALQQLVSSAIPGGGGGGGGAGGGSGGGGGGGFGA